MACQSIWGYFMPRGTLYVYIYIFLFFFFSFCTRLYDIKYSFTNNLQTNLLANGILIIATTPGQSASGSNNNERVGIPQSLELQNWSFTTRCSLVSYPRHFFLVGILPLCSRFCQSIVWHYRWMLAVKSRDWTFLLITHNWFLCSLTLK